MPILPETPSPKRATRQRFTIFRLLSFITLILGTLAPASSWASLAWTYDSVADVPVTAAAYAASGTATLALNSALPTGTNLMVVKNTGLGFISGAFSNLAQGQAVALSFGRVTYQFVANYYGGSGNDLVLQWASVHPMAWGRNNNGQLGNNSKTQGNVPVAVLQSSGVLAGKTVISVAAGESHSLALCSDGTLAAWGYNTYGQLSNNSTTDSKVPVAVLQSSGVLAGKTVIAVAAGNYHSLALCSDGTLAAWGYNAFGQLGNSSTTDSNVPVAVLQSSGVLAGKTVIAVSAGNYHSLALCSDGALAAWGRNNDSQLGNSSTTDSNVPVAVLQSSGVLSGKTVIAVSVGAAHSLALCSDGTLAAWGSNGNGRLGNNSMVQGTAPVAVLQSSDVLSGKTVIAIAAGQAHSLALCSDGTLAAWGDNFNGSLGNNSTTDSRAPVAVLQSSGVLSGKMVIAVTAGQAHSRALCADGTLATWGDNFYGQLGNSSTTDSTVPLAVSTTPLATGEGFTNVGSGSTSYHTLALVAAPPPLEITVSGNGVDIADGDTIPSTTDCTYLGSVATTASTLVRTFTISNSGPNNSGTTALILSNVTAGGTNAADFSVTTQPAANVDIAGSTTFEVTFNPSANGLRSATLSFTYNFETPFNFSIQGTGVTTAPTAIALSATSIAENNMANAIIGTLSATDADQGDVPTFSLVSGIGSTDNGSFSISGSTLKLTPSADFETKSSYAIRIGVNDGQGGTFESPFTITITDELEAPTVTTPTIAGIAATAADLGGNVTFDGGVTVTERGVVYSATATNADPSLGGPGVTTVTAGGTTGVFTVPATDLSPSTGYSFRAYATNAQGTSYTSVVSFSTTITATYTAATDVPVTAASFTASGSTVTLDLGYAPVTGTNLMVVKNTGLDFITGTFSNLAQGQAVALSFGRVTYQFVANYYGGSGNDLVLHWANVRPMAWGYNARGQLGNSSTTNSTVPVAVLQSGALLGKTVISVAAGSAHSLALCSDGTLAAWGYNNSGQLGNNSTTQSSVPVAVLQSSGVLFGKTIIAIAAGGSHNLALCSDGTLAAWGNNIYGQLGNNSGMWSTVPIAVLQSSGVLFGKTVIAVSAGADHSLALCSDGTLAAWGYNTEGQLGNNSATNSGVPVAVQQSGVLAGKTVVSIEAGATHNLALCSDGTLAAWGRNDYGQLGNSSTTQSRVPISVLQSSGVLFGKTVISVAAGTFHSLVLCSNGTLAAWGNNFYGQLGNDSTTNSTVPMTVLQSSGVLAGKPVIAVAAGYYHSLALCVDGTLAAWGDNDDGQLGNSSTTDSTVPVAVSATPLATGERFTTVGGSTFFNTALVAVPPPLEITVSGNSMEIADGDSIPSTTDFTDFGGVTTAGGTVVHTFTISNSGPTNSGTAALTLGSVTVGGTDAADFSVAVQPAAHVPIAGSTTFQIAFNPSANGLRRATLSFTYNDGDENPFDFSIQGTALNTAPTAIELSASIIAENNAPNATVGTLSAADVDPGDVPTFSLVSGTGSTDNADFSITGAALKLTPSADFETKSSYAIRIGVNDGQGGTFESPFIITITDELDVPTVTKPTIASLTDTGADLGGNVTFGGGTDITERGVVYSATATNAAPSIGGTGVTQVTASGTTGVFAVPVTGLSPNTGYSFRAYATNDQGTGYTSVGSFGTGITFTYAAATDVPVTAANYTAGGTITLALGFAPVTGTNLMVVQNTGLDFISGAFSNLAQGQKVALSFNGVTYQFVANYYGGNGNDLVLQWANVRPMAWGRNDYGQLGNNSMTNSTVPAAVLQSGVLAGKTVIAVSAGSLHSLALCSDGTLAASGYNNAGQLGNNSTTPSNLPVAVNQSGVLFGKTVIAVAAGSLHSLALCSDGTLAAWGYNGYGQLGDTSTTDSSVPVAVNQSGVLFGKTVIAVAAGSLHSLALCSDGTLAAWGYNGAGQLGNNSTTNSNVPVAVQQSSGALSRKMVIAVAAGQIHSLALCSDGTLAAWGYNAYGQLGDNSTTQSTVPVAVRQSSGVLAGMTVIAIAAGYYHSLALCADGTLAAWGYNLSGQLGNNSTMQSNVPVAVRQSSGVLAGKTVIAVKAGNYHSLALCSDGALTAWGSNYYGQLGIGSSSQQGFSSPLTASRATLTIGERFTTASSGSSASHTLALVASPPASEITVSGNSVDITDDDSTPSSADFTDFGNVALANTQVTHTFTIGSGGDVALNLTGSPRVQISGPAAADFKVTALPAATLAPNTTTGFAISFDPSLPGLRSALVTIANDDPLRGPFTFAIQGFGELSAPLAQTITFTAPATVYLAQSPLQLSATASSGLPVSLSLVSGPPGTTLTDGLLTCASAGTVKVQATRSGGGNYAAAKPVMRTFAIKTNPTALTLTQLNQMYDGTPKPIDTEGGAGDVEITYTVNGASTSTPPANAGTYAVKAVAGTETKTGKLVIAKAPLYVAPDDQRKFAGQANPALTAAYSGFIAPDNEAVMTSLPVLSTTAKTTSPGGVYPIKASGGSALNYTLIYQLGTLVVESFAGNYEALLLDAAALPIGKLNLTVTASGTAFSGKLLTATETAALSLKGPLTTDPITEVAAGSVTVTKSLIPYAISFTLAMDGAITASVTRDSILLGASDNGRKLLLLPKGQAAPYAGAHTAVFEPATPAGDTVPLGAGWATASISTSSVVTLAGKLGDGTTFTTALSPDTDNDPGYRLFIQPYKPLRDQSYFGGFFTLVPHPSLPNRRHVAEAALIWNKKGLPGDASYRAGFGPISTVLTLDPWLKPAGTDTLQVRLGLAGNSFAITYSPTGSAAHGKLPASVSLTPANAVSVPVTLPANETKWQTKLNITTGAFTGSFVLQDTDPAQNRTAPFSGVLRQPSDALDTVIGDGHFLLPARTGAPSPEKLSGEVLFQRP